MKVRASAETPKNLLILSLKTVQKFEQALLTRHSALSTDSWQYTQTPYLSSSLHVPLQDRAETTACCCIIVGVPTTAAAAAGRVCEASPRHHHWWHCSQLLCGSSAAGCGCRKRLQPRLRGNKFEAVMWQELAAGPSLGLEAWRISCRWCTDGASVTVV